MSKPPSQNAIGRALGLSSPAMTKMKKQGCPMTSIEAVRAWREKHLNIAMRKPEPRRTAPAQHEPLAHAQACMRGAAALLGAGLPLDVFAPTLRAALAVVQPELRDAEGLTLHAREKRFECTRTGVGCAQIMPPAPPSCGHAINRRERSKGGHELCNAARHAWLTTNSSTAAAR